MSKKKVRQEKPNTFLKAPVGFVPHLWNRLIADGRVFELVELETEIAEEENRLFNIWHLVGLALYEGFITATSDVTELLGGEPGQLPNPAIYPKRYQPVTDQATTKPELRPVG